MPRRTHAELEVENLVLYREMEAIHDRLGRLLADDGMRDDDDFDDDEQDITEEPNAGDAD